MSRICSRWLHRHRAKSPAQRRSTSFWHSSSKHPEASMLAVVREREDPLQRCRGMGCNQSSGGRLD